MGSKFLNDFRNGVKAMLQDTAGILLDSPANPIAPTVIAGTAGVLTGQYRYAITFIFDRGETPSGAETTVALASQQGNLTVIPTGPTGYGRPVCRGRGVYRTLAGGATGTEKLVTILND